MTKRMQRSLFLVVAASMGLFLASGAIAAEKPRVAVMEFEMDANNPYYHWWSGRGGARAASEVFTTELVKSGQFRMMERARIDDILSEHNLGQSGAVDSATAARVGRLIGVEYMLVGAVTKYGADVAGGTTPRVGKLPSVSFKRKKFHAEINARLIHVETGEIVWADSSYKETKSGALRVRGVGGGSDDQAPFDKVLTPMIQELCMGLKAADL